MIKIEAFVREDKFEDVKEALAKIEVHGITVYQVMGCGIQRRHTFYRRKGYNLIFTVATVARSSRSKLN